MPTAPLEAIHFLTPDVLDDIAKVHKVGHESEVLLKRQIFFGGAPTHGGNHRKIRSSKTVDRKAKRIKRQKLKR